MPESTVPRIRRHSSAPSSLLLDACLRKISSLSDQVDTVLDRVQKVSKSKSEPNLSSGFHETVDSVLGELIDRTVEFSARKMVRQCHHCHRPCSHPDHAGVASGVNLCSLDHYELCPGGRQTGAGWTGCPPSESEEDSHDENSAQDNASSSSTETVIGEGNLKTQLIINNHDEEKKIETKLDPKVVENAIAEAASKAYDVNVLELEDTNDEEEMHLQEEIEK